MKSKAIDLKSKTRDLGVADSRIEDSIVGTLSPQSVLLKFSAPLALSLAVFLEARDQTCHTLGLSSGNLPCVCYQNPVDFGRLWCFESGFSRTG